jgi:hypothetical protein
MILGVISFFFLVAFSIVYVGKTLTGKPAFLEKAEQKITDNLHQIAFWGFGYSIVAILLTPVFAHGNFALLVQLAANIVLFMMALPYALDQLLAKYPDKVPAALIGELKNLVGIVGKKEKAVGYAGAALSFLLFLTLFR